MRWCAIQCNCHGQSTVIQLSTDSQLSHPMQLSRTTNISAIHRPVYRIADRILRFSCRLLRKCVTRKTEKHRNDCSGRLPRTVTRSVASADPESFFRRMVYCPPSPRSASLITSSAWFSVVCRQFINAILYASAGR